MGNIRDRPWTLVRCGDVEIRAATDPSVFTITEKAPLLGPYLGLLLVEIASECLGRQQNYHHGQAV